MLWVIGIIVCIVIFVIWGNTSADEVYENSKPIISSIEEIFAAMDGAGNDVLQKKLDKEFEEKYRFKKFQVTGILLRVSEFSKKSYRVALGTSKSTKYPYGDGFSYSFEFVIPASPEAENKILSLQIGQRITIQGRLVYREQFWAHRYFDQCVILS